MPHVPASQPPSKLPRRFFSRRIFWLTLLILFGPWAVMQVPLEVGRWKLAAAVQARAEGDKEAAYEKLAEAMRWIPNSEILLVQQADWQLADGEKDAALTNAEKLLELSGESYIGLELHSQLMQKVGRHMEAVADWKKIDRLSQRSGRPSRAQALNGLAYAQALAKVDLEQALKHVEDSLELVGEASSDRYQLLDTRGYLLYLLGRYDASLADMHQAVEGMEDALRAAASKSGPAPKMPAAHAKLLTNPTESLTSSNVAAVLFYHRALVEQALGKEADAAADLKKARILIGREPDENLF